MAKIRLIGELDMELTRLGLKPNDIILNATYSSGNKAMYFTVHYVITNECVVYPQNYKIIKLSETEKNKQLNKEQ